MAKWHVVQQGEWLSKIAALYWIADPNTIWNHPENEQLKKLRKPELLFPGDKVYVPDLPLEPSKTGEKHTIVMKLPKPATLKIKILNADENPLANKKYQLRLGGKEFSGSSSGEGEVNVENIELLGEHEGTLTFPEIPLSFSLTVGHLNPAHKKSADDKAYDDGISGVQMRLANLGFYTGEFDGILETPTREAIRYFQLFTMKRSTDKATGGLDNETRDAILKAYGS